MEWKLLATETLKKYKFYKIALHTLPNLISSLDDDISSIKAVAYDRIPSNCKQYGIETTMAENLDMRNFLELRLKAIRKKVAAIEKAFSALTDEEKAIVDAYFCSNGKIEDLTAELHLERSAIYAKKDLALERFAMGLGLLN